VYRFFDNFSVPGKKRGGRFGTAYVKSKKIFRHVPALTLQYLAKFHGFPVGAFNLKKSDAFFPEGEKMYFRVQHCKPALFGKVKGRFNIGCVKGDVIDRAGRKKRLVVFIGFDAQIIEPHKTNPAVFFFQECFVRQLKSQTPVKIKRRVHVVSRDTDVLEPGCKFTHVNTPSLFLARVV
jgi:hypothetical protein